MKANRTFNHPLIAILSTGVFLTSEGTLEAQNSAPPIDVAPVDGSANAGAGGSGNSIKLNNGTSKTNAVRNNFAGMNNSKEPAKNSLGNTPSQNSAKTSPTNNVFGAKNSSQKPTNTALGTTNSTKPTNVNLGVTNAAQKPTNNVLGPTNTSLGSLNSSGTQFNNSKVNAASMGNHIPSNNASGASKKNTNALPTNNTDIPPLATNTTSANTTDATSSATPVNSLQEHVTLVYRDAFLLDVIRHLCEESKINHVIAPAVAETAGTRTITLKLTDITYEVALKTVLDLFLLGTVLDNGIVRIDSLENIKREQEDKKKIRDERIKQEPTRVAIYQLNYVQSNNIAPMVTQAMRSHSIIDARFSVQADVHSNRLIVEAVQDAQVRVKTLIENLDKRKQQVVIEARIIEASNDVSRAFRINWGARFGLDAGRGLASGLIFPNSILGNIGGAGEVVDLGVGRKNPGPGQIGLSVGSINGMFNIDGILKAYESEKLANIIASPTLTVMDNEKGHFDETIETQIVIPPAAGSTSTGTTSTFKSALAVDVTPMIAADGSIELDVSVQRDTPDSTPTALTQSKIGRNAKTKLAIRHGETAVIGGLYQTTKTKDQGRIPILGSLPIIGTLFRTNDNYTKRTELMILLTPRVVSNATGPSATATASDFVPTPTSSPIAQPPSTSASLNPTSQMNSLNGNLSKNQTQSSQESGKETSGDSSTEALDALDAPSSNGSSNMAKAPQNKAGGGNMNNLNSLNSLNSPQSSAGKGDAPMGDTSTGDIPSPTPSTNSAGGGAPLNNLNSLD